MDNFEKSIMSLYIVGIIIIITLFDAKLAYIV